MKASPGGGTPLRKPVAVTAVAVLAVAAALALAGRSQLGAEVPFLAPCWVMGAGWVVKPPGESGCDLRTLDRVRQVSAGNTASMPVTKPGDLERVARDSGGNAWVEVERGNHAFDHRYLSHPLGREAAFARWYAAAVVAALLLTIPLVVLWRSRWTAAQPLCLIASCVAIVAISLISGRSSEGAALYSAIALALIPAALAHLALSFPTRRKILDDAPLVVSLLYAIAFLVAATGIAGLTTNPLIFPVFAWLVFAGTAGSWSALLIACFFAVRDSTSHFERSRARLVAFGASLLPLVPTLAMIRDDTRAAEIGMTYLWSCLLVLPLPIGLAISRYNLFDLGSDARRWIARALYYGIAGLLIAVVLHAVMGHGHAAHPIRDVFVLFGIAITGLIVVDSLRQPLLGFLDHLLRPQIEKLAGLSDAFSRSLAGIRDADEVAARLGRCLRRGLQPRCGSILVREGGLWRVAHAFGKNPPVQLSWVPVAESALAGRGLCQPTLPTKTGNDASLELEAAGIEIVAALDASPQCLGLVLLGGSALGEPYARVQRNFVVGLATRTAAAMQQTTLLRDLVRAERRKAESQTAISLIHDIGKDLGWLRQLLKRSDGAGVRAFSPGDLADARSLSDSVIDRLRHFMQAVQFGDVPLPGVCSLDEALQLPLATLSRRHGEGRLHRNIDPGAFGLRCHENLGRAVAHLVENGLQASAQDRVVHLAASAIEEGWIEIVVTDEGPGIPDEWLESAFEPGFTTRRSEGGSGLGLAIARDIALGLGGHIELGRSSTGGTRATLRVPGHKKGSKAA